MREPRKDRGIPAFNRASNDWYLSEYLDAVLLQYSAIGVSHVIRLVNTNRLQSSTAATIKLFSLLDAFASGTH